MNGNINNNQQKQWYLHTFAVKTEDKAKIGAYLKKILAPGEQYAYINWNNSEYRYQVHTTKQNIGILGNITTQKSSANSKTFKQTASYKNAVVFTQPSQVMNNAINNNINNNQNKPGSYMIGNYSFKPDFFYRTHNGKLYDGKIISDKVATMSTCEKSGYKYFQDHFKNCKDKVVYVEPLDADEKKKMDTLFQSPYSRLEHNDCFAHIINKDAYEQVRKEKPQCTNAEIPYIVGSPDFSLQDHNRNNKINFSK